MASPRPRGPIPEAAIDAHPRVGPAPEGAAVVELSGRSVVVDLSSRRSRRRPASRGIANASRWQLVTKRGIDLAGALVGLALLSPLLVVTALAVATTSRGPVLFRQERVGRGGRPFTMLKFRSMRRDAEEIKARLAHLNEKAGPIFKIRYDPRLTAVGRWIRRTSVDELPQLLNVLRGDMSLVGPRPPLPDEFQQYDARERSRMRATPGLTCVWQVSGRSEVDFDTWVAMDLDYIENWTLRRDLRLMARTVPAVISRRGAY